MHVQQTGRVLPSTGNKQELQKIVLEHGRVSDPIAAETLAATISDNVYGTIYRQVMLRNVDFSGILKAYKESFTQTYDIFNLQNLAAGVVDYFLRSGDEVLANTPHNISALSLRISQHGRVKDTAAAETLANDIAANIYQALDHNQVMVGNVDVQEILKQRSTEFGPAFSTYNRNRLATSLVNYIHTTGKYAATKSNIRLLSSQVMGHGQVRDEDAARSLARNIAADVYRAITRSGLR